ncbi:hypothetical protein SY2F82_27490 [Streptomyces sp. Y2F8-2]|nr:hypothetical protein SY2F82_27490 [Streptomyces sp. Y2F8-2]
MQAPRYDPAGEAARDAAPRTAPESTRGPRRLGGTLNPPGTAARSINGRGVCGPGRPKVEEPEQSGQRAPVPRSAFLCGEGGACVFTYFT